MWILVRSRQGAFGAWGEVIVRCRDGHLVATLLIPIASFKAIRLGLGKFQYCLAGELIAVFRIAYSSRPSTAGSFLDLRVQFSGTTIAA